MTCFWWTCDHIWIFCDTHCARNQFDLFGVLHSRQVTTIPGIFHHSHHQERGGVGNSARATAQHKTDLKPIFTWLVSCNVHHCCVIPSHLWIIGYKNIVWTVLLWCIIIVMQPDSAVRIAILFKAWWSPQLFVCAHVCVYVFMCVCVWLCVCLCVCKS